MRCDSERKVDIILSGCFCFWFWAWMEWLGGSYMLNDEMIGDEEEDGEKNDGLFYKRSLKLNFESHPEPIRGTQIYSRQALTTSMASIWMTGRSGHHFFWIRETLRAALEVPFARWLERRPTTLIFREGSCN